MLPLYGRVVAVRAPFLFSHPGMHLGYLTEDTSMEQSDLMQLKREVLDRGPEAALPCNLPDKWLGLLARDIEMLSQEQDSSHSYLSAPLAVIAQLLLGKSGHKDNEVSFSVEELFEYLQYLEIEIAIEVARCEADIDAAPATMETIFTNRIT